MVYSKFCHARPLGILPHPFCFRKKPVEAKVPLLVRCFPEKWFFIEKPASSVESYFLWAFMTIQINSAMTNIINIITP